MRQFKKEWVASDFKKVHKAALKLFRGDIFTHHGYHHITNYKQLDEIAGFAYTSSGKWACEGLCNTNIYLDEERKYWYDYLAVTDDLEADVYVICTDKDENELYIPLK